MAADGDNGHAGRESSKPAGGKVVLPRDLNVGRRGGLLSGMRMTLKTESSAISESSVKKGLSR